MFHLLSSIIPLNSSKKMRFLKYHIGSVILFGLLYWLQDNVVNMFSKWFIKYGFENSIDSPNSLFYWMWHSLVTQTTVGYSGTATSSGEHMAFNKITNNVFKILNMLQLLSIFFITAQLI